MSKPMELQNSFNESCQQYFNDRRTQLGKEEFENSIWAIYENYAKKIAQSDKEKYVWQELVRFTGHTPKYAGMFYSGDPEIDVDIFFLVDWLLESVHIADWKSESITKVEELEDDILKLKTLQTALSNTKIKPNLFSSTKEILNLYRTSTTSSFETDRVSSEESIVLDESYELADTKIILDRLLESIEKEIGWRNHSIEQSKKLATKLNTKGIRETTFVRVLTNQFENGINSKLHGTVATLANAILGANLTKQNVIDKLRGYEIDSTSL